MTAYSLKEESNIIHAITIGLSFMPLEVPEEIKETKEITLIKKFPEFIQKIQNTILFIKSDIVPFKILPIDCNALMPALDPALETFLELYC